jgi:hypothetical protein
MPDKFELARGWFLKADSDLAVKRSRLATRGGSAQTAGY